MNEKDTSYWTGRQEQRYIAGERQINSYYRGLEQSFEQAKREIKAVVNNFYACYADANGVSFADAQLLLSREEIRGLSEFISRVNESMGEYDLALNNMSIKARITRYQALEKQLDAILQQLYAVDYNIKGKELMKDVFNESFYRTWYSSDVYTGFHAEFAQVDPKTIEELIKYPFNGANFSTRLWKQKDHLLQTLNEAITTMLIQGRNPNTLSKDFASLFTNAAIGTKEFKTKKYEAYRLLHTEGSFIMEQGTLAAYKEDGVEKYQILATLDNKTSDICQGEDGEVYLISEWNTGVNAPPYHIFCRTTTIPYYEDDNEPGTRVARDSSTGKSYEVPSNMKYPEWKEKYVHNMP